MILVACKIIMSNCRNLRNSSRERKKITITCVLPTHALEDPKITITCLLPTHALEDPSSQFAGEDDEVDLKFDMFLSDCPGEEEDNAYLG